MKKIIYMLLAACALLPAACTSGGSETEQINHVVTGDPVPRFNLTDNRNTGFDSREEGVKELIFFFTTECPYCSDAMPVIEQLWIAMKDDPAFRFIAVGRGETTATLDRYFGGTAYTFPYAADPAQEVYNMFAGNYIPRLYVVRDGKISWWSVGMPDGMDSDGLMARINGTI